MEFALLEVPNNSSPPRSCRTQLPCTAIPQQHPRKLSVLQARSEFQPHCFAHLCRVTKPDRGYRISILSKDPNAQLEPRGVSAHLKRVSTAPRLHFWSKSVAEVLPNAFRAIGHGAAHVRSPSCSKRAHISAPFLSKNPSRRVSPPPNSPADFSAAPPPFPYGPGRCSALSPAGLPHPRRDGVAAPQPG